MEKHTRTIVLASNNRHKAEEIMAVSGAFITVITMERAGIVADIPETGATLEENAVLKARYVHNLTRMDTLADDSGLEVEALGRKPGVYSARYAGPENDSAKNIAKLLKELQGQSNRNAQFRTVLALIEGGFEYQFEGIVEGEITYQSIGLNGFGYDSVFRCRENEKTFAEISFQEKNQMSHRGKAVRLLLKHLKTTR